VMEPLHVQCVYYIAKFCRIVLWGLPSQCIVLKQCTVNIKDNPFFLDVY
jgi:uncharacterized protein (UPF0218 family)